MNREQFRTDARNFQSALKEMAHVHMQEGDDVAAGLLLVIERRLYTSIIEYDLRAPAEGEGTPVPARRRGRRKKTEAPPEEPKP